MFEKTTVPVKNFVRKHRVGIAITVTAVACLALNKRNMNEVDKFLKEHDLYDEYWNSEEYPS